MNRSLIILVLALFASDIPAQSNTFGCEAALIKNRVNWEFDQSLRLSFLKLIDRQSFSTDRNSIAGGVELPVDGIPLSAFGSYDDFNEARNSEFQKYEFNYDRDEAQAYVSSSLSPEGASAFVECLRIKSQSSYGVHLIPKEISPDFVSFDIYWNPPPGVANIEVEQVRVSGNNTPLPALDVLRANSYKAVDLERDSTRPFRFSLAAGGYSPVRLSVPLPIEAPIATRDPTEMVGYVPRLLVLAHIQGLGDVEGRENRWVGTKGQNRRLEGFGIAFDESVPGLGPMALS